MEGWKTRVGGVLLILAGAGGMAATWLGFPGLAWDDGLGLIGGGFAALGLGHKFDKLKQALQIVKPGAKILLVALGAGLLLSACATTGTGPGAADDDGEQLSALAQFARDDLKYAYDDAVAHNDTSAARCWRCLLDILDEGGFHFAIPKGAASQIQAARDLRRGNTAGVLRDRLVDACGGVVTDARITILRLVAMAGGKVASGGLLPPLPFAP